jgi:hypothetical protein
MKNTSSGLGITIRNEWQESVEAMSYRNIASGLAGEMLGFIRPSESRRCSPPFKMVIIDKCGTVVFECRVSKGGKVRPFGSERKVKHSHFPATALLTDSAFVTRTFLIENAASSNGNN